MLKDLFFTFAQPNPFLSDELAQPVWSFGEVLFLFREMDIFCSKFLAFFHWQRLWFEKFMDSAADNSVKQIFCILRARKLLHDWNLTHFEVILQGNSLLTMLYIIFAMWGLQKYVYTNDTLSSSILKDTMRESIIVFIFLTRGVIKWQKLM